MVHVFEHETHRIVGRTVDTDKWNEATVSEPTARQGRFEKPLPANSQSVGKTGE